jgi:ATP-dependent protease ClpP protease subunit
MKFALSLLLLLLTAGATPKKPAYLQLHSQVDGESAYNLITKIEASQGASEIFLDIDSGGGSVGAGLKIIEAMHASQVKLTCTVTGLAGSMAHVILSQCDKRVMVAGRSVLMLHHLSVSDVSGTPEDIQALATQMKELDDQLLVMETAKTKKTPHSRVQDALAYPRACFSLGVY